MIFIAVKFTVRPEYSDEWIDRVGDFTEATRREPGNLWFEGSLSLETRDEFVLLEAFEEGDAAGEHVNSDHFKDVLVPGSAWSKLAEISVPD